MPSEHSFASVARQLGTNQEMLRHWLRSSKRSQQPQGSGDASANAELARLRKENAELKTKREIPQLTAAYCAQKTKWGAAFASPGHHQHAYSIKRLCRALDVSRSDWCRGKATASSPVPDLLERDFSVGRPHQRWCDDITSLPAAGR